MGIFVSYILLGLSLAAPIGPINAAQLDKGIKKGFWHAWILGLGAILADAVYMALVYFGVVHFLEMDFMKAFLWLFGFFVLTYTGIETVLSAGKLVIDEREVNDSHFSSFLSGFLMSISNPLTMLFWLGIYGSVLANAADKYDIQHLIVYSSAIFFGILCWDITMALVSSSFRKFLTQPILVLISALSGLSLICFGVYFAIQAAKILF
ncbi:amino acid transporter [Peribacillus asahii]|uniref:Amino acid transporter n=1 Tax=Peribacillus asahii TaxID=228899 RepID=A0A398B224_9BACI|nr:LysE family transporter [Peribacillus asahii]RID83701.1 amino acid transporter [Peribacillus asahii]